MLCDQKQDNFLNVVIGGDETILYGYCHGEYMA